MRRGSWVRTKRGGSPRGTVTEVENRRVLVRWVGTGRGRWASKRLCGRASHPGRSCWKAHSLDRALDSLRSERDALENWCESLGIPLAFKNAH